MQNSGNYRAVGGSKKNKLPNRWDNYTAMGSLVPGTRFLPFKTPLKEEICKRSLSTSNWFTPAMLLEKAPKIKLVIDLTQTDRFYSKEELLENGVQHKKIVCPGGGRQLIPHHIFHEFTRVIDGFLESKEGLDKDALIGVHCTHGLNRTGYLICKYMVLRYGIPAQEAIDAFENARGHKIERALYVDDILRSSMPPQYSPQQSHSQIRSNRMANAHPYRRESPLDGCYTETRRGYTETRRGYTETRRDYTETRRDYTERNIFYPQF